MQRGDEGLDAILLQPHEGLGVTGEVSAPAGCLTGPEASTPPGHS